MGWLVNVLVSGLLGGLIGSGAYLGVLWPIENWMDRRRYGQAYHSRRMILWCWVTAVAAFAVAVVGISGRWLYA